MWRYALGLVGVLVLLLGAGRWLVGPHDGGKRVTHPAVTTPENSDYYMKDATIYQLNADGGLAYRAHSAEALHFPDDSARLRDVDLHYVNSQDGVWNVHAAQGRVPANTHAIFLYGGIRGLHPRAKGQVIRFETPHAWVYPDRNLVTSDAPVKAFEAGQVVTADGMRVNLDTSTLKLLDNVHVTYANSE